MSVARYQLAFNSENPETVKLGLKELTEKILVDHQCPSLFHDFCFGWSNYWKNGIQLGCPVKTVGILKSFVEASPQLEELFVLWDMRARYEKDSQLVLLHLQCTNAILHCSAEKTSFCKGVLSRIIHDYLDIIMKQLESKDFYLIQQTFYILFYCLRYQITIPESILDFIFDEKQQFKNLFVKENIAANSSYDPEERDIRLSELVDNDHPKFEMPGYIMLFVWQILHSNDPILITKCLKSMETINMLLQMIQRVEFPTQRILLTGAYYLVTQNSHCKSHINILLSTGFWKKVIKLYELHEDEEEEVIAHEPSVAAQLQQPTATSTRKADTDDIEIAGVETNFTSGKLSKKKNKKDQKVVKTEVVKETDQQTTKTVSISMIKDFIISIVQLLEPIHSGSNNASLSKYTRNLLQVCHHLLELLSPIKVPSHQQIVGFVLQQNPALFSKCISMIHLTSWEPTLPNATTTTTSAPANPSSGNKKNKEAPGSVDYEKTMKYYIWLMETAPVDELYMLPDLANTSPTIDSDTTTTTTKLKKQSTSNTSNPFEGNATNNKKTSSKTEGKEIGSAVDTLWKELFHHSAEVIDNDFNATLTEEDLEGDELYLARLEALYEGEEDINPLGEDDITEDSLEKYVEQEDVRAKQRLQKMVKHKASKKYNSELTALEELNIRLKNWLEKLFATWTPSGFNKKEFSKLVHNKQDQIMFHKIGIDLLHAWMQRIVRYLEFHVVPVYPTLFATHNSASNNAVTNVVQQLLSDILVEFFPDYGQFCNLRIKLYEFREIVFAAANTAANPPSINKNEANMITEDIDMGDLEIGTTDPSSIVSQSNHTKDAKSAEEMIGDLKQLYNDTLSMYFDTYALYFQYLFPLIQKQKFDYLKLFDDLLPITLLGQASVAEKAHTTEHQPVTILDIIFPVTIEKLFNFLVHFTQYLMTKPSSTISMQWFGSRDDMNKLWIFLFTNKEYSLSSTSSNTSMKHCLYWRLCYLQHICAHREAIVMTTGKINEENRLSTYLSSIVYELLLSTQLFEGHGVYEYELHSEAFLWSQWCTVSSTALPSSVSLKRSMEDLTLIEILLRISHFWNVEIAIQVYSLLSSSNAGKDLFNITSLLESFVSKIGGEEAESEETLFPFSPVFYVSICLAMGYFSLFANQFPSHIQAYVNTLKNSSSNLVEATQEIKEKASIFFEKFATTLQIRCEQIIQRYCWERIIICNGVRSPHEYANFVVALCEQTPRYLPKQRLDVKEFVTEIKQFTVVTAVPSLDTTESTVTKALPMKDISVPMKDFVKQQFASVTELQAFIPSIIFHLPEILTAIKSTGSNDKITATPSMITISEFIQSNWLFIGLQYLAAARFNAQNNGIVVEQLLSTSSTATENGKESKKKKQKRDGQTKVADSSVNDKMSRKQKRKDFKQVSEWLLSKFFVFFPKQISSAHHNHTGSSLFLLPILLAYIYSCNQLVHPDAVKTKDRSTKEEIQEMEDVLDSHSIASSWLVLADHLCALVLQILNTNALTSDRDQTYVQQVLEWYILKLYAFPAVDSSASFLATSSGAFGNFVRKVLSILLPVHVTQNIDTKKSNQKKIKDQIQCDTKVIDYYCDKVISVFQTTSVAGTETSMKGSILWQLLHDTNILALLHALLQYTQAATADNGSSTLKYDIILSYYSQLRCTSSILTTENNETASSMQPLLLTSPRSASSLKEWVSTNDPIMTLMYYLQPPQLISLLYYFLDAQTLYYLQNEHDPREIGFIPECVFTKVLLHTNTLNVNTKNTSDRTKMIPLTGITRTTGISTTTSYPLTLHQTTLSLSMIHSDSTLHTFIQYLLNKTPSLLSTVPFTTTTLSGNKRVRIEVTKEKDDEAALMDVEEKEEEEENEKVRVLLERRKELLRTTWLQNTSIAYDLWMTYVHTHTSQQLISTTKAKQIEEEYWYTYFTILSQLQQQWSSVLDMSHSVQDLAKLLQSVAGLSRNNWHGWDTEKTKGFLTWLENMLLVNPVIHALSDTMNDKRTVSLRETLQTIFKCIPITSLATETTTDLWSIYFYVYLINVFYNTLDTSKEHLYELEYVYSPIMSVPLHILTLSNESLPLWQTLFCYHVDILIQCNALHSASKEETDRVRILTLNEQVIQSLSVSVGLLKTIEVTPESQVMLEKVYTALERWMKSSLKYHLSNELILQSLLQVQMMIFHQSLTVPNTEKTVLQQLLHLSHIPKTKAFHPLMFLKLLLSHSQLTALLAQYDDIQSMVAVTTVWRILYTLIKYLTLIEEGQFFQLSESSIAYVKKIIVSNYQGSLSEKDRILCQLLLIFHEKNLWEKTIYDILPQPLLPVSSSHVNNANASTTNAGTTYGGAHAKGTTTTAATADNTMELPLYALFKTSIVHQTCSHFPLHRNFHPVPFRWEVPLLTSTTNLKLTDIVYPMQLHQDTAAVDTKVSDDEEIIIPSQEIDWHMDDIIDIQNGNNIGNTIMHRYDPIYWIPYFYALLTPFSPSYLSMKRQQRQQQQQQQRKTQKADKHAEHIYAREDEEDEESPFLVRPFIQCGALSLIFMSLTSNCTRLRVYALACLQMIWEILNVPEESDGDDGKTSEHHGPVSYRDRQEIVLLLSYVRNAIGPYEHTQYTELSTDQIPQITTYQAIFLAKSAMIVLQSKHELFVPIGRYLSGKAYLKTQELPLFESILQSLDFSNSMNTEWLTIVRMIRDSLVTIQDHKNFLHHSVYTHIMMLITIVMKTTYSMQVTGNNYGPQGMSMTDFYRLAQSMLDIVEKGFGQYASYVTLVDEYDILPWLYDMISPQVNMIHAFQCQRIIQEEEELRITTEIDTLYQEDRKLFDAIGIERNTMINEEESKEKYLQYIEQRPAVKIPRTFVLTEESSTTAVAHERNSERVQAQAIVAQNYTFSQYTIRGILLYRRLLWGKYLRFITKSTYGKDTGNGDRKLNARLSRARQEADDEEEEEEAGEDEDNEDNEVVSVSDDEMIGDEDEQEDIMAEDEGEESTTAADRATATTATAAGRMKPVKRITPESTPEEVAAYREYLQERCMTQPFIPAEDIWIDLDHEIQAMNSILQQILACDESFWKRHTEYLHTVILCIWDLMILMNTEPNRNASFIGGTKSSPPQHDQETAEEEEEKHFLDDITIEDYIAEGRPASLPMNQLEAFLLKLFVMYTQTTSTTTTAPAFLVDAMLLWGMLPYTSSQEWKHASPIVKVQVLAYLQDLITTHSSSRTTVDSSSSTTTNKPTSMMHILRAKGFAGHNTASTGASTTYYCVNHFYENFLTSYLQDTTENHHNSNTNQHTILRLEEKHALFWTLFQQKIFTSQDPLPSSLGSSMIVYCAIRSFHRLLLQNACFQELDMPLIMSTMTTTSTSPTAPTDNRKYLESMLVFLVTTWKTATGHIPEINPTHRISPSEPGQVIHDNLAVYRVPSTVVMTDFYRAFNPYQPSETPGMYHLHPTLQRPILPKNYTNICSSAWSISIANTSYLISSMAFLLRKLLLTHYYDSFFPHRMSLKQDLSSLCHYYQCIHRVFIPFRPETTSTATATAVSDGEGGDPGTRYYEPRVEDILTACVMGTTEGSEGSESAETAVSSSLNASTLLSFYEHFVQLTLLLLSASQHQHHTLSMDMHFTLPVQQDVTTTTTTASTTTTSKATNAMEYYANVIHAQMMSLKEHYISQGYASKQFVDSQETRKQQLRTQVTGTKTILLKPSSANKHSMISSFEEEIAKVFEQLLQLDKAEEVGNEEKEVVEVSQELAAPLSLLANNQKNAPAKKRKIVRK